jgi:hypothetical protein
MQQRPSTTAFGGRPGGRRALERALQAPRELLQQLRRESQEVPPSDEYLASLLLAARRRALPGNYIKKLERPNWRKQTLEAAH